MTRPMIPLLLAAGLCGCSLAPTYNRPSLPTPPGWKAPEGWRAANPAAEGMVRSDWWASFEDAALDDLVTRANAHNQTLAQAAATYAQAAATAREARAGLFPTVTANGSITHSAVGRSGTTNFNTGSGSSTSYQLTGDASWAPDLFGRQRNTLANARDTAQARLADLANARLLLQANLVSDYLSLRAADAQIASLRASVAAFQRSLTIATNRYNAGIAARTDVFQAQSQLASAQSDLEGERRTRVQFENAIAVLVGEVASSFTVAPLASAWVPTIPVVPATLPSTLIERRPDIAAAERQVAAANAQIGVQRAAFFPTIGLSASGGVSGTSLGGLFGAATSLWSLGTSAAQTLFDFGARKARVAEARAAYLGTVAAYREAVLTAFGDVENGLSATDILARQEAFLRTASIAADRSEAAIRNQYRAGLVAYTNVVIAQSTALNARRALIQAQLDRQNAVVSLTQALGGGWSDADLANGAEAARAAGLVEGPRP